MKLRIWLWLAMFLSAAAFAEPVAMVTDVSGSVSTIEKGKSQKLALLSYLEPGTALQLDAGSRLSVTFFANSTEYRFTGPARLTVEAGRISGGEAGGQARTVALQKTSAARKFTAAQRESVTQAAFEMRSGRPGVRLDDPVDTSLVDASSALFSWDGPLDAKGYLLSLYDSHNQLLYQTNVASNQWVPEARLLQPGNAYEWEVKSALENGEILTARGGFSVADAATAKAVLEQTPKAGASFSDRVLHAVFLEENGFKYDARRLWRELAKERPNDVVVRERAVR